MQIRTDWALSPPVELWRRPVGPGWSSFAVRDGLVYTQEQRGDFEVVACYNATTGEPVWTHRDAARFWESNGGARPRGTPTLHGGRVYTFGATGIVNALDAASGALLISTSDAAGGLGTRRLAVAHGPGGWTVDEVWTSRGLKPYFNDFVVHEGHAFGFDGSVLSCIDLQDGKRKWKGGRYGHGQMLLLADQDLLLVLSEEGELALVAAAPDQFTEVARFRAMEDKTWNHPVLAGDILFVRNGQEMVAFRLPLAGS